MMSGIEITGIIAGILTTISYVPQVLKVIKTRNTTDLSLTWLTLNFVGLFLWFVYGMYINSLGLALSTFITLLLLAIIIYTKLLQNITLKRVLKTYFNTNPI